MTQLHHNSHYGNRGCGIFKWGVLNFEFWINGELSKIGHHFSNKKIQKLILSKNVNNKKCAAQLVFFNKKIEKNSDDF